jgi:hypothetical protein
MDNNINSNIESVNRKNSDDKENLFSDISSSNSREHSRSRGRSNDRSRSNDKSSERHEKNFVIKNGCCRDCMKAFSKTGKSCLCQVPKGERKYILSDKGCNFCGCHGNTNYI